MCFYGVIPYFLGVGVLVAYMWGQPIFWVIRRGDTLSPVLLL